MVAITQGNAVPTAPTDGAAAACGGFPLAVVQPGSSEARVVSALADCVARWGLQKTTVDDLARASGLSRATVYRLFPGGKQAIVEATASTELARLAAAVGDELDRADDLAGALTAAISTAASFLAANSAFAYLRAHEPEVLEAFVAYDRLDAVLHTAGVLVGGSLARFLPDDEAVEVAKWAARVVVSYLDSPAPGLDPTRPADARRLVTTYLLPGLPAASVEPSPSR